MEGTGIIFGISKKDGKTEVRFAHAGLVLSYKYYKICRGDVVNIFKKAWETRSKDKNRLTIKNVKKTGSKV